MKAKKGPGVGSTGAKDQRTRKATGNEDAGKALKAALEYAARGIPVFPCRRETKRPRTPHGFLDATTETAVIERWWRRWPDAMIGMPTGPASGIAVLDL